MQDQQQAHPGRAGHPDGRQAGSSRRALQARRFGGHQGGHQVQQFKGVSPLDKKGLPNHVFPQHECRSTIPGVSQHHPRTTDNKDKHRAFSFCARERINAACFFVLAVSSFGEEVKLKSDDLFRVDHLMEIDVKMLPSDWEKLRKESDRSNASMSRILAAVLQVVIVLIYTRLRSV